MCYVAKAGTKQLEDLLQRMEDRGRWRMEAGDDELACARSPKSGSARLKTLKPMGGRRRSNACTVSYNKVLKGFVGLLGRDAAASLREVRLDVDVYPCMHVQLRAPVGILGLQETARRIGSRSPAGVAESAARAHGPLSLGFAGYSCHSRCDGAWGSRRCMSKVGRTAWMICSTLSSRSVSGLRC